MFAQRKLERTLITIMLYRKIRWPITDYFFCFKVDRYINAHFRLFALIKDVYVVSRNSEHTVVPLDSCQTVCCCTWRCVELIGHNLRTLERWHVVSGAGYRLGHFGYGARSRLITLDDSSILTCIPTDVVVVEHEIRPFPRAVTHQDQLKAAFLKMWFVNYSIKSNKFDGGPLGHRNIEKKDLASKFTRIKADQLHHSIT